MRARCLHALLWLSLLAGQLEAAQWRGVPCSRFYAFDEIEGFTAGAAFSFDRFGRVALPQNGRCLVLNDEAWLDAVDGRISWPQVRQVICDADGESYFGAVGAWGRLVPTDRGLLSPESLVPESCPDWAQTMEFTRIVSTASGVCFGGLTGVAIWNRSAGNTSFVRVSGLARVFVLGDRIYVSSHGAGVQQVDVGAGTLGERGQTPFQGRVVEEMAPLGRSQAIFSTSDRRLWRYTDGVVAPLLGPMGEEMGGRITALAAIPSGDIAVAVLGIGLYLISPEGGIHAFLSDLEYRDIKALASNEPGVVWAVTQGGLLKVLCGFPVTRFSPTNGLPVFWPQFLLHRDRLYAASSGHLYEEVETAPGSPTQFRWVPEQPRQGVWGVAAFGESLLVGNRDGVWERKDGGLFEQVLKGMEVDRLAMLKCGRCVVIGMKEIAVLQRDEQGRWRECAPRVPGIGYPALVQVSSQAVWIELGANIVGRIAWDAGRLRADVIRAFPWKDPRWVHISVAGETVILSGPDGGRVYWDETTGRLKEHADVETVLSELGPQWPARIAFTESGDLWTSHARGVSLFRRMADGWVEDATSYRIVDCPIPRIAVLGERGVLFSNGAEVYAVGPPVGIRQPIQDAFSPRVVGLSVLGAGGSLLEGGAFRSGVRLPFSQSGFSLRLFSGSYAARRPPQYELSINGGKWAPMDGSSLSLSNLREGTYHLDIQLADRRGPLGRPLALDFAVAPPWNRTAAAYVSYALAVVLAGALLARFAARRSRKRNEELESLVRLKTSALEQTMEQLEHEARNSATLAERNRLAGEIHDTLEQSLTALALQLSSTAQHPECSGPVKTGLAIARNMVVFSRDEVRNAVWDLHTQSVGAEGLAGALQRLVDETVPAGVTGRMVVTGVARPLGSLVEHHLLRMAQEAMANAVKHAGPRQVEVALSYGETEVVLLICDDGSGFVPEEVHALPVGHFGLRFLRGRAAKIGGRLEISSSPGKGTTITVTVPLPPRSRS